MVDLLDLCRELPVIEVEPGAIVVREGEVGGRVFVLEEGTLRVRKGETLVNSIDKPGALVGEISILLDSPYSATVEAITPSRLRYAEDGASFLGDPEIVRLIAVGLAERLNYVTAYLADLKQQYVDAPGLSMVGSVLDKLAQRQQAPVRGWSARDPDPEY